MPRKKTAPKFTGELAKPITPPVGASAAAQALLRAPDKRQEYVLSEILRKLPRLARHYGLEWAGVQRSALPLLLALAHDFVPGFRVVVKSPSKRGRPADVWGPAGYLNLLADFDKALHAVPAHAKQRERKAAEHLVKTNRKYQPKGNMHTPRGGVPRTEEAMRKQIDVILQRRREAKKSILAPLYAALSERGLESVLLDALHKTK
jgi:hypothetical protein